MRRTQKAVVQKLGNRKGMTFVLVMVTATGWGLSFVAMNRLLMKIGPMQVLAERWLLSALVFLLVFAVKGMRIDVRKKNFKYLILTAVLEPAFYSVFEVYGLKYTSPSISSIFIATIPCMALLLGILLFHRKSTATGIIGIALAFSGVLCCTIFSPDFSVGGSMKGYLLMSLAVIFGAFYSYSSAKAGEDYSPMEITAAMAILGAVVYNIICLFMGYGASTFTVPARSGILLLCVIFLGVFCSTVCYMCFNKVLGYIEPAAANNMIGSMTTVIGVIAGILISGDPWGIYTVVGLVLTVSGVLLSSRSE